MNSPEHGFWIQTRTGVAFDLSEPKPEMVAEVRPEWALAALLHDAEEAYIGDLSSPFKALLRDNGAAAVLAQISHNIRAVVSDRFDLWLTKPSTYGSHLIHDSHKMGQRHHVIKQADLRMLATERRDLMPEEPDWSASWFAATGHPKPEPYGWNLDECDWATAEEEAVAFLNDFSTYGGVL